MDSPLLPDALPEVPSSEAVEPHEGALHAWETEGGAVVPTADHAAHDDRTAIRMAPGHTVGFFPAHDPRSGFYQTDRVYLVPEDLTAAKAQALVDGGTFAWCDRPKGE